MSVKFQLDDLQVFCIAARKAGFAAAATELGMSPAYVSKRIAVLEKALGVTLFHRAARRVTVTDEGERVYASAQQIFQGVAEMGETVAGGRLDPRGTLRVTTSFRLGRKHLGPILSLLAQQYPALEITLDAVDRRVDLIAENVDLDVRIGDVDEPHLVAHRIADSTRVLCAAPGYVDRRGMPANIAELSRHDCLVLRDRNQAFGVWRLTGPHGVEKVKVTGRLSSNNSEIVRGWGNDGHGILLQARWDVSADLAAGRLLRVLPDCSQPADIWAASTVRLSHSAKVRVCVRFLQEQLASGPFALRQ
ncbi:putative DNA-binding transcriptional regulator [Rubrivivax sp. A210]|uniref:LysR family transcriptional regulator n=1 Tax=Rubrivivax sp. A210 TaxID=2772301 RepID=UPI0019866FE8|nr:LysR family transcriptional regulator [Rubrivivax sp. A210]CAD5375151.1 putative DNA-binding transcriptional regulator [Rubrivivax sp. A210]